MKILKNKTYNNLIELNKIYKKIIFEEFTKVKFLRELKLEETLLQEMELNLKYQLFK